MPDSVHLLFEATAAHFADRPFLNVLSETAEAYGIEAGELTYGEAKATVGGLRSAYAAAGYGPGHRVGLLLENRPSFVLHFLGLNAVGASIVPVNPDLRSAELEYLTEHSEIALAVATRERADDLRAAREGLTVIDPDGAIPTAPSPTRDEAIGPKSEAAILYTSGTTGKPKGCILDNVYFLQCGRWYHEMGGVCELREGQERMVNPLPLFHMNALACSLMGMIATGGCLSVLDRFHPRSWWDQVREARATCIHYLGVMPPMLMNQPASDADRDHDVRFGFGAGVPPALHAPFEDRFGFPLVEAWAMTETGAGGVITAHREPRPVGTASFGKAEGDVEARVVLEDGREAAPGEPGELLVRRAGSDPRAGFFAGYLKNPEATAEAWEGGWLHTGDVVARDAEGNLTFVDRRKNVIRRSGENIAAAEVEAVIREHPSVREVAVTPVPDEVRGDEVFACIVTDEPGEATARSVFDHVMGRLAYYKAPGHVAFVDALPVTATNKVQRQDLKDLAAAELEAGRALDLTAFKKRSR